MKISDDIRLMVFENVSEPFKQKTKRDTKQVNFSVSKKKFNS